MYEPEYTWQFTGNPNSNALAADRSHHTCPAACVIAQQYFSTSSSPLCAFIPARKISSDF